MEEHAKQMEDEQVAAKDAQLQALKDELEQFKLRDSNAPAGLLPSPSAHLYHH